MFKLIRRRIVYGFRSEIAQSLSKTIGFGKANFASRGSEVTVFARAYLDVE
jgi:pyruvate/2-oxoglutarate/acetoin dehydrogenase E1 component